MPIRLRVEGLSAKRGEDLIFHDISFVLEAGEALIVTGPNGSGKSTLLRVLSGLLTPESGSVRLDDTSADIGHPRELCHYLGHRNAMKRELTVAENLSFWKSFMGDSPSGSGIGIEEATEALGLGGISHLPFGYLSAGQQRRIAMAKLLVAHRPVWILDEPTAALDAAADRMFAGLVERHLSAGGIAVAATHQPLGVDARELRMTGFAGVFEEVSS
jgi:heme exporter protein A